MSASLAEVDQDRLLADLAEHIHCPTCGAPVVPGDDHKRFRELGRDDNHLCTQHVVRDHMCPDCQEWVGYLPNGKAVNMPNLTPHECEWAPIPVAGATR